MLWDIWLTFVGFLEQTLMWFAAITGHMGLGIILFTIFARMAILPLTLKSISSSRKVQELQPQLKELQRKYGKDQQKLSQEMMKLYQEHKVNPVGGCLPMLLQLPIFIGVYHAIMHLFFIDQRQHLGTELHAAVVDQNIEPLLTQSPPFGWLWPLTNIQNADDIIHLLEQPFFGINLGTAALPFHGIEYIVLPILAVVLQFIQQMMAMPRVQDPQQKMMSQVMMIFPIIFGYIAFTFPAGAALYWVTTSLVGIIQQYFISGWGSLANYLTFLPADQSPSPALALSSGTAATSSAAPAAPPQSFWEVLSPLTGDDGGHRPGQSTHDQSDDDSPDSALAELDKASESQPESVPASRRRSNRRRS